MAAYSSTLTSKGQVTMPVEIRRALNLNAGDDLEFIQLSDGRYLLRALNAAPSAFFEAVPPREAVAGSDREALDALMIERSAPPPKRAAE